MSATHNATSLHRATMSIRYWLRGLLRLLLVLIMLSAAISAHAACSPWMGKAYFNEFFFGPSGGGNPPNFLEIFSADNAFPAIWQNWKVDVYERFNEPTEYEFTNDTAAACTKSSKTWVTHTLDGGLNGGRGLVVLKDAEGRPVDVFAFDNATPPVPWQNKDSNWFPGLQGACKALYDKLNTQASKSSTMPNQANMLIWQSQGNKDYSRIPDGGSPNGDGKPFFITSLTGAGTTYTTCSTNNANFSKTAASPTVVKGGTATFLLTFSNVDDSSLSGVVVQDTVPAGMTDVTATPSDGSGIATISTQTNGPTTVTWTLKPLAANSTATLTLTAKVPPDPPGVDTAGTVYTNTAETTSGITPAQSDSASVTVISPNTASFLVTANKYSVCTSATASSTPPAPIVTITAMDGANGTGTKISNFTGSVTLTTSTGHGTWSKVPDKAAGTLSGNVYTFHPDDEGQAQFYLVNDSAESVYVTATHVSATGAVTSGDSDIPITYAGSTLSLAGVDNVQPTFYTAVAGRPHALRATLSSCGSGSAPSGSTTTRVWYTPSMSHPSTQAVHVSTSSTCTSSVPLAIALLNSAPPASGNLSLNFVAGSPTTTSSAIFYLCTTDVGQYAINLAMPSAQTASPNFTVRPFALTVSGISKGGTPNPGGATATSQVFTSAGSSFSATFDAWRWSAAADNSSIAPNLASDGIPNSNVTLSTVSAAGRTPGFSASARIKATLNTPSAGAEGILESKALGSVIPVISDENPQIPGKRTVRDLFYTEVGSFELGGLDGVGSSMVKDYLGAPDVNVPTLVFQSNGTPGAVVGRFNPHHFSTTVIHGCAAGGFTYSAQPFGVKVIAEREGGGTTLNYRSGYGFARDVTLSNSGAGVGILTNGQINASNFISGVADWNGVRFTATGRVDPFTLPIRAEESASSTPPSDGVTSITPTSTSAITTEGTTNLRIGSLFIENAYGSELLPLPVNISARYWRAGQFVLNTDDKCTTFADLNLGFVYPSTGELNSSNLGNSHIKQVGDEKMDKGKMKLNVLPPANTPTPLTKRNFVDLGPSGQNFLPGTGRLTFGTYRSRFIYMRERY